MYVIYMWSKGKERENAMFVQINIYYFVNLRSLSVYSSYPTLLRVAIRVSINQNSSTRQISIYLLRLGK